MLSRLTRLSKDALIYGLGGAAARFTGFILLPIYTRAFADTATYGVLQAVNNLGALLLAVTVLGLDGATSILFFATDSPVERQRINTLWVAISLVVAIPLAVLLILLSGWVSLAASGTPENAALFAIGAAVLPFNLLQFVVSHILRFYFRPRMYALLNVALTVLVLFFSVGLLIVGRMGVYSAVWGTLIGTTVVAVGGLWTVREWVRVNLLDAQAWRLAVRMLRLGAPLVPASIALWVISFSNTYFLTLLRGAGEAGVFRAGAQLAAVLGIGVWAFQLAWLPYSLSIAREPDAPQVYSRVATLYTAGAVGASVLMAGLSPLIVLLVRSDYAAASSVIGLLSLAAASLGSYYVVSVGVNIAQRTGQVGWTTLVAAGANLSLNALLIPVWGIVGAGLASLVANLLSTVLVYYVSQRFYPLPYEPLKILVIWLAGSACVAAAGVFNMAVRPGILLAVAFTLLLLILFGATLLASRSVTVRQLVALVGTTDDRRQTTVGDGNAKTRRTRRTRKD